MSFNALPYLVSWAVLVCIVLGLAVYRVALLVRAGREGPPHICNARTSQVARMYANTHREETVQKWGEILTVIALIYGLAIAAAYAYYVLNTRQAF